MKYLTFIALVAGFTASSGQAQTADLAPTNLSSVIFNGTVTSSTGNPDAPNMISALFTSNGIDYALNPNGTLSDPVAFAYTKTGASTGRIREAAVGSLPSDCVALSFSSATTDLNENWPTLVWSSLAHPPES